MAAQEQWEIDLRNQLLDGPELQKEKMRKERVRASLTPDPEPLRTALKKEPESLLGYYVIIVLLIIMSLFIYNQKCGGDIASWFANRIQFADEKKTPPVNVPPANKSNDIVQLKLDMEKMKQDIEIMSSKLKWNSDRIALMGVLMNENFVIMGNNYDRSDLIFFNADWTINKMPRYLQIQENDRKYLQKFVKPNQ